MNFHFWLKMEEPGRENVICMIQNGPDQKLKRTSKFNSSKTDIILISTFSTVVRYKQKKLPKKPSCCHQNKKYQCRSLKDEDIVGFANDFYKSKDKPAQDSFVLIYCKVQPPNRTNRSKKNGSRKNVSIEYSVRKVNGKLVQVCRTAFHGILNVGKDRVQGVCKRHLSTGAAPKESRGGDHRSSQYFAKKRSVIEYIKKFKCIEVHYCRGKTKRQYLPSELSINKMHSMYCDQITDPDLQVKGSYFRFVFNTNFNIGFKAPATDVCSTCTMLKESMKLEKNADQKQVLMNRLVVHKRRAKAFFKLLKEGKNNTITLSIDCQKNMAVPKLFDQAAYFSRQISFYNFGVVQGTSKSTLTKENVFLYVWGENDRPKGSNEISSAVYHRLCNLTIPENVDCIRLFADGCGGQNKNTILMTMCSYWLTSKAPHNIQKMEIIFPVVGHSFIPPDRVFARIEKSVKTKESIVSPAEYIEIFEKFGTVVNLGGEDCPVLDFKTEANSYCKLPGNWHFKFNPTKRFELSKRNNSVEVRGEVSYVSNLNASKSVWKRGKNIVNMNPEHLPTGIALKSAKTDDVKNLLLKHFGEKWREMERLTFLNSIIPVNAKDKKKTNVDEIDELTDDDCECEFHDEGTETRV